MVRVPQKVGDRLSREVRRFQRILRQAQDRDVNESDTVTIITDMLARIFGFDKYTEVTTEQAIRGTYCDIAVKVNDSIHYLVEVKAIGLPLKDSHIRQAVNYGANHGVPWTVLTNGVRWQIYGVRFERPVGHELVCEFDFLALNAKSGQDRDRLFLLCREGLAKAAIEEFHEHVRTVNRFVIGAIIGSDAVISVIRRQLRRLAPDARVTHEEIRALLPEVLKRDVLEGERAQEAARRVQRAAGKPLRKGTGKKTRRMMRQELPNERAEEQSKLAAGEAGGELGSEANVT